MTAYVVWIGDAYYVRSHHEFLIDAMRECINTRPHSFAAIVRDGKDAKRYSVSECEEYLQKHQPQRNHKRRARR